MLLNINVPDKIYCLCNTELVIYVNGNRNRHLCTVPFVSIIGLYLWSCCTRKT